MEQREIINRISSSSLVTLDLEKLYTPGQRVLIDIKDQLFEGLILREKDFRSFVNGHDWSRFKSCYAAVTCTADAVVPTWAYMLVASSLQPSAARIVFGGLSGLESELFRSKLSEVDWDQYRGAKVVVKGCSNIEVPVSAYVEAMARLRQVAASVMYGEPCSTVPLYKAKKS